MFRTRGLILFVTAMSLTSFAKADSAKQVDNPKGKAKSGLSEILGTLDWGATYTDVIKDTKRRLEDQWKGKMKVLDTLGMDRLRREKKAEFKKIRASFKRFDGQQTGYESSIIADEILVGKNEAVLEQYISNQTRYYFFRDERLWKIAVVFDAASAKGFTGFIKLLRRVFQAKPKAYGYRRGLGKKVKNSATWRGKMTVVTARDRREFYNAYLVRFVQKETGEAFQSERGQVQKPSGTQPKNALLGGLFDDSGEGAGEGADENVVDALTGSKHEVDLRAGRLETAPPMPQFDDEDTSAKKTSSKKKKKKVKKKAPSAEPVSKPAKMVY